MKYEKFISEKQSKMVASGFEAKELNKHLFKFQDYIVRRALSCGKYAIFADCGLGKTLMQLEWAYQVAKKTNKAVIILAPLAVSGQTIKEGEKFGIKVEKWTVGLQALISVNHSSGVYITNYENIEKIDPQFYTGVVLDESSILKNFDGKTKQLIIDKFEQTEYKLACTATPSPNDPMELGNHAEFLNKMSRNEMLAMYFVHDGGNTSKWRLKGHSVKHFYNWVSTWATMISSPEDIGFDASGYDLPSLNFIEREVEVEKKDNGKLFNDVSVSAVDFNKELRLTIFERMETVAEIVNNSNENFIIWVKQNGEADELKKLIPDAVEVRGNDKPHIKEERLLGFANNEFRVLITKTKIAQFGLNYQNCSNQIFASLDFSFEALYQAIRRSYRFGQTKEVNIYLLTLETMGNVIKSIKEKQNKFEIMQKEMSKATSKADKRYKNESTGEIFEGNNFKFINGDCVEQIKNIESESIGFSIFSPPFAELYTYSDDEKDMGNSKDFDQFMNHFNYLIPELHRVMESGRNIAIHCMDLPIQKGKEGYIGLRDFSGMLIKSFQDAGFILHSKVTIWKNPVTEMQRTKALGLLHKQLGKDSSMSRVGIPDYLLVFRKRGENKNPISTGIDVDTWQKWASPVWMDINYSNTLQRESARDDKDEKHICPLQLDTIERAIELWSNKGDTVLSPFGGIGSEGFQALKMDRQYIGIELKKSYFEVAIKNLQSVEAGKAQLNLL